MRRGWNARRRTAAIRVSAALVAVGLVGPLGGYAAADNLNQAPSKTLAGPATGLDSPFGIAFDSGGAMYVTNGAASTVTAYLSGWATGNTAPARTLAGPGTELSQPRGIAFDSTGAMYVANFATSSVTAYAAGWATGGTSPAKILSGPGSGIEGPVGLAFDADDHMYVANSGGNTVTVYPAGWVTGDTAPTKTLAGVSTGLNAPWAIAFDSGGSMHVTNAGGSASVTAYPPGWATGNAAPTKTLAGGSTGLDTPAGIAFGPGDAMHVSSFFGNSVTVYGAGWTSGDTAPTRSLTGVSSGLDAPAGIAFGADGSLHVSNLGADAVLEYPALGVGQSITFPMPPSTAVNAGPLTVAATASSGLPVSFASATNTVCTVAGDQITLLAVGTCTVNANQPGNGTYLRANQVTRSFAVTPAPKVNQRPARACVTDGARPRAGVAKQLMLSGCATNAGRRVAVSISATKSRAAGSARSRYELYCQVGRKTRQTIAAGYGGSYRVCAAGQMLVRAKTRNLRLRITWFAPATSGYNAYWLARTYLM